MVAASSADAAAEDEAVLLELRSAFEIALTNDEATWSSTLPLPMAEEFADVDEEENEVEDSFESSRPAWASSLTNSSTRAPIGFRALGCARPPSSLLWPLIDMLSNVSSALNMFPRLL